MSLIERRDGRKSGGKPSIRLEIVRSRVDRVECCAPSRGTPLVHTPLIGPEQWKGVRRETIIVGYEDAELCETLKQAQSSTYFNLNLKLKLLRIALQYIFSLKLKMIDSCSFVKTIISNGKWPLIGFLLL